MLFIQITFTLFILCAISGFLIHLISCLNADATTSATIIDLKRVPRENLYIPVLQFYVDGKEYTCVANSGGRAGEFNIGENIEIKYRKENPNDMYIKKHMKGKIISGIFIIIFFAWIFFKARSYFI